MRDIQQILKQYWGYDQFRPLQQKIIESVLNGHDTLALMPTGGGKSICYQVPAMAMQGMCLVISPLIALMKDQVENLRKKNITAYAIYSGMNRKEVINVLKVVTESNCKFLYVSPERLETALFKEYLPGMGIKLIAVDEAHCISQWGYDFRPPYLRIAALREELPGVPVLALTASATLDVQGDICDKLSLLTSPTSPLAPLHPSTPLRRGEQSLKDETALPKEKHNNWNIFKQSFERSNLSYSIFQVDSKINKIAEVLNKVPGTSIVYCKSRRRTKEISELLQAQGIVADFYHAGLTQEERSRKQEEWISNKTRVIVCTNAFGMGIDKPDVRSVVHADVPDCLENYYQEAGRAGRDGKKSYAVLLYNETDLAELDAITQQRYPALQDIRDVYQAIANYLQLHTGDGEGNYYDFDLVDFIKKFKLDSQTVLHSLKALEQDGWLSFTEQLFISSKVQFNATKDALYAFEKQYPAYEVLIKTLLRTYEGIFDQPAFISEKLLAYLLKKDAAEIKKQLEQVHRFRIIDYQPQKDIPQLFFLRRRIRASDVAIDITAFNQRKERFEKRVRQMIRYVNEEKECRSRIIGSYFGDSDIKPCGVCDNCLRQKNTSLSREEFDHIHQRIVSLVNKQSLSAKELLQKLSGIKTEKAWKVLDFLQAEQKIAVDSEGNVKMC